METISATPQSKARVQREIDDKVSQKVEQPAERYNVNCGCVPIKNDVAFAVSTDRITRLQMYKISFQSCD